MDRRGLCALMLVLAAGTGPAFGQEILVRNGSFEADALADGEWHFMDPQDWAASGGGLENPLSAWYPTEAPHGQNVAYLDSGLAWLAQELIYDDGTDVLCAEGLTFSFGFWIGRSQDPAGAGDEPGVVDVFLECESGGAWERFGAEYTYDMAAEGLTRGAWDWVDVTLTMSNVSTEFVGRPVLLTFQNVASSNPAYLAQIHLDGVTPEPASALLVAFGAAGLVLRRRRA